MARSVPGYLFSVGTKFDSMQIVQNRARDEIRALNDARMVAALAKVTGAAIPA